MASYRVLLNRLRQSFPQPFSDRVHDSYFVHSVMRALDGVDSLKGDLPLLGAKGDLDYAQARQRAMPEHSMALEDVTQELGKYLSGITLWGHPGSQQNLVPPPTIASLVANLLAGLANPNLASDEYAHRFAIAEVETIAMVSNLIGYDPEKAGGLFTFGGTATNLYALRVALAKVIANVAEDGVREDVLVFASDSAHYCRESIASWLGLGTKNLVTIPTRDDNSMDLDVFRERAENALAKGQKIAMVVATMGTTDAFGIDNLKEIAKIRDELVASFGLSYRPHVHADAVIGWVWSAFNHYPFEQNPMGFRPRTVRALAAAGHKIRNLHLADSVGIDFHKTGFAPYISSAVVFRNHGDLSLLSRAEESMPYLFHYGHYKPGIYSLETSRAGTGVLSALANLKLFGIEGLSATIGHLVEMSQLLREHLEAHASIVVLNRENVGTVTLFRVYPPEVDTFTLRKEELEDARYEDRLLAHNDYNRRVSDYLHAEAMEGRGVFLSLTECYRHTPYGAPIVALKSYVLSPFLDEEHVASIVEKILDAQRKISALDAAPKAQGILPNKA